MDVQRAYACPPPGPNTAHFAAVFLTAAHEAQLEHVVTLSQWLSVGAAGELHERSRRPGELHDGYPWGIA